jgi:hypothetical protein
MRVWDSPTPEESDLETKAVSQAATLAYVHEQGGRERMRSSLDLAGDHLIRDTNQLGKGVACDTQRIQILVQTAMPKFMVGMRVRIPVPFNLSSRTPTSPQTSTPSHSLQSCQTKPLHPKQ